MKNDPLQIARSRELRQKATTAESILWQKLRNRRFADFKFRRQQTIGPFIVDFYCSRLGLVIELDGDSHLGQEGRDRKRQEWLEFKGLRIVRILNVDLYENQDGVMDQIERECRMLDSSQPLVEGETLGLRQRAKDRAAPSP